jgi:hypothetical protein
VETSLIGNVVAVKSSLIRRQNWINEAPGTPNDRGLVKSLNSGDARRAYSESFTGRYFFAPRGHRICFFPTNGNHSPLFLR